MNIRDFSGIDGDGAAVYLDYRRFTMPDIIKDNANNNIN